MKKWIYSMATTQTKNVTIYSIDWWITYRSETPKLVEIAKNVLSQSISISLAEGNWNTYSYIHTIKRNR